MSCVSGKTWNELCKTWNELHNSWNELCEQNKLCNSRLFSVLGLYSLQVIKREQVLWMCVFATSTSCGDGTYERTQCNVYVHPDLRLMGASCRMRIVNSILKLYNLANIDVTRISMFFCPKDDCQSSFCSRQFETSQVRNCQKGNVFFTHLVQTKSLTRTFSVAQVDVIAAKENCSISKDINNYTCDDDVAGVSPCNMWR